MTENRCIVCNAIIPEGLQICIACGEYDDMQTFQRKVVTNGDKLRSMTDKELSRWIASMERRALFTNSVTRPEGWQKWLESEAPDE